MRPVRDGIITVEGIFGGVLVAAAVSMTGVWAVGNKPEKAAAERAQQAENWDGIKPLLCSYAAGKEQTVRPAGFNDLQILEIRKRIADGTCRLSAPPTAG